jgi:NAD(P)-dependent dehydrogenase (short-subunit alcohol dehydrogenase family)
MEVILNEIKNTPKDIEVLKALLNEDNKSVMKAISFLASDGANFITCQDIYVDGGWISKGI